MIRAAYNAFLYLSWFLSTKSAYTGQDDSWVYIWGAQYTSSKLYAGHSFLYLHRRPLNGCGSPTVFPRSSFSLGFFSMIDSTPGIYQGGKRIILRKVMILFYICQDGIEETVQHMFFECTSSITRWSTFFGQSKVVYFKCLCGRTSLFTTPILYGNLHDSNLVHP